MLPSEAQHAALRRTVIPAVMSTPLALSVLPAFTKPARTGSSHANCSKPNPATSGIPITIDIRATDTAIARAFQPAATRNP